MWSDLDRLQLLQCLLQGILPREQRGPLSCDARGLLDQVDARAGICGHHLAEPLLVVQDHCADQLLGSQLRNVLGLHLDVLG